jgi:hypothetical protein
MQTRLVTDQLLRANIKTALPAVALLGMRGYYRDTMGRPGVNDRGIYDDAIILRTESAHVAFNANTDPSVARKHIAVLKRGVWQYKVGTHGLSKPKAQQYTALVQAGEVTVIRDQEGPDTGYFGINIHRGSYSGTSSLGCQTIFPDQWAAFIALVQSELKRAAQKIIPYVLVEANA